MRRFLMTVVAILIAFDGGGGRSMAAEQTEGAVTLAALIERALERSESIASLRARVEQERYAARQAGAWQNPSADLAGGLKSESGTGALFEVSVSQPVFYPGKQRLRREIGELDTEGAEADLRETELFVIREVVALAYEYVTGRRKTEVNEERQNRFELIRTYLTGHLLPSPQQKVERRLVERRLANLATEAMQLQGQVKATFEGLNFYAGLHSTPPPDIEIPRLSGSGAVDRAKWLAAAMEGNVELAAGKIRLGAARKEKDLAQLEAKPDFTPGIFYEHERGGTAQRLIGAGISLPVPVLNRNIAGIESSERKIEAKRRLLRFTEQQIEARLGRLWNEYEAARFAVQRYPESLSKELDAGLKEADEEFRKGRLDLLTFLELDSEIAETRLRALDAQFSLADKVLDLLGLAGERDVLSLLATQ